MRARTAPACTATLTLFMAVASSPAGVNIGGITFVDRGLSGEVTLGNLRGGMSVLDFDHDGWMDLIIAGFAGQPASLFHNVPDPLNPGRRTFTAVPGDIGLADAELLATEGRILVTGDYDNDGHDDAFFSGNELDAETCGLLLRNNGDGSFDNVTTTAGVRSTGFIHSASWCDYDLDGDLDLFFCSSPGVTPTQRLMRNNGDGTFTDAAASLPPVSLSQIPYAHAWIDLNEDGWPDCLIPQSSTTGVILHNVAAPAGGRQFTDTGAAWGFINNGPAPMGITAGDYDNDGDLDIAMSDATAGSYYENVGGGHLQKITPFTSDFGWGVTWIDAENDGDIDLYMCGRLGGANFDRLFRNLGNKQFDDVGAALNGAFAASQHCVQIDFNNDGRQDIVTLNPGGGSPGNFTSVFENGSTSGHHWIKVALAPAGPPVNRNAANAVVRVTAGGLTRVGVVLNGSSYTATEDRRLNFGLGTTTVVDAIEVVWPRAGSIAARSDVYPGPFAADQIVVLAPLPRPGDLDCSGVVDGDDVASFVAVLLNSENPGGASGVCDWTRADFNESGTVDTSDVQLFVDCLLEQTCQPER